MDDAVLEQPLDEVAVRVLGSLIEKEFTTPENYPLTLNALRAACNQTSNRDPVMELDEDAVKGGLETLAKRGFARAWHRGDARVMRYRQELSASLHLHPPELAALCVLLLRGPQTAGEIRTRTARMVEFNSLKHVEITLESLMALSTPLVVQLPLRPGQKEARYAHLLAGEPQAEATEDAGMAAPLRDAPVRERLEAIEEELGALRAEVAEVRARLEEFMRQFD